MTDGLRGAKHVRTIPYILLQLGRSSRSNSKQFVNTIETMVKMILILQRNVMQIRWKSSGLVSNRMKILQKFFKKQIENQVFDYLTTQSRQQSSQRSAVFPAIRSCRSGADCSCAYESVTGTSNYDPTLMTRSHGPRARTRIFVCVRTSSEQATDLYRQYLTILARATNTQSEQRQYQLQPVNSARSLHYKPLRKGRLLGQHTQF